MAPRFIQVWPRRIFRIGAVLCLALGLVLLAMWPAPQRVMTRKRLHKPSTHLVGHALDSPKCGKGFYAGSSNDALMAF
jgi:hypothetical protein